MRHSLVRQTQPGRFAKMGRESTLEADNARSKASQEDHRGDDLFYELFAEIVARLSLRR